MAAVEGLRAAGGEAAAGWDLIETGRSPRDRGQEAFGLVDVGKGGEEQAGVGVLGVAEHLGDRALLDHYPAVHDHRPVAGLGHHSQIVGDEHQAHVHLGPQGSQQVHDLGLDHHVEGGRGLVGGHQALAAGQGEGDHGSLAHAPGELVGVVAGPISPDAHRFQQSAGLGVGPVGGYLRVVLADGLGYLPADRLHRVEGVHRPLEDHGEVAPAQRTQLVRGEGHQVAPVEPHLAAGNGPARGEQAEGGEHGGGLAAARLAHQSHRLAAVDVDRYPVGGDQRGVAHLEADLEVADGEEHLGPGGRSSRARPSAGLPSPGDAGRGGG